MSQQQTPLITIRTACHILANGGIIAYPTESSFGLGCDATKHAAVMKIQQLKQRDANKTFIVLIKNSEQAKAFIHPKQHSLLDKAQNFWPGPYTLLFPVADTCPQWLQSEGKIALRHSTFSICQQLTTQYPNPIISTSANIQGQPPIHYTQGITDQFPQLDGIIDGQPQGQKPTSIIDMLTNATIR